MTGLLERLGSKVDEFNSLVEYADEEGYVDEVRDCYTSVWDCGERLGYLDRVDSHFHSNECLAHTESDDKSRHLGRFMVDVGHKGGWAYLDDGVLCMQFQITCKDGSAPATDPLYYAWLTTPGLVSFPIRFLLVCPDSGWLIVMSGAEYVKKTVKKNGSSIPYTRPINGRELTFLDISGLERLPLNVVKRRRLVNG